MVVLLARIVDPGIDRHKVRNEGRDFTLQNCRIAPDDVLVLGLSHVVLIDNWR